MVHSGPDGWSGFLFFGEVMFWTFLLVKALAGPAQEVSGWWIRHVADLGQAPVWCLAFTVNTQAARVLHHDKAEVLQFAKPAPNVIAMAMRARVLQLRRGSIDRCVRCS